ncbi:MAG: class I SAM-dependent methyltransferase [Lentisphaerae bacterium]|nr:class I SAM-dependent methyltransferase [Lentisphaerota bacterium]
MDSTPASDDRFSLRQWSQDSAKQKAKGWLGRVLMRLFPARAALLQKSDFTHHGRRASLLNRLIGAGIAYQALRHRDFGRLGEYHRKFWGGEHAKAYHADAPERFEAVFLRYYTPLIDALEGVLEPAGIGATFCEIGSGAGLLVDYLARRFTSAERLIGIDLDPVTTAEARAAFPDSKLEFIAADALDYIGAHGRPNWVYLTQNGVLEYFDPDAIERFFRLVAAQKPAVVALIEPVGMNHDLDAQQDSCPYGQEFGFSHNYPYLLEKNGFRIVYRHEELVFGVRFLLILAKAA